LLESFAFEQARRALTLRVLRGTEVIELTATPAELAD
jgi:hypothetical protein